MKFSAIIATFNEEHYIRRCIESLLDQRDLGDDFEIIVVDGCSNDRTTSIVKSFPQFGTTITLYQNPKRFQVYAWNIGWRAARGEYVSFIGAHTEYNNRFFHECLEIMTRTGAAAVGPVQVPYGKGLFGRATAWAMSSPFGIGNAVYRYATEEVFTDSVFAGVFKRETLERLGGYDERVTFDEDAELNYRLKELGEKIVVSPAISIRYYVRESPLALSNQMYRYGYWRRMTQILHPHRTPARVLAPPALVLAFILSATTHLTIGKRLGAVLPLLYGSFLLTAAAVATARSRDIAVGATVPLVLSVMHLSYGIGWWHGLFTVKKHLRHPPNGSS